ncbi:hemolysin activation protein [Carnobacterium maltaromaticum]|nr:hemolysin activation protein [Carnobacterium maltaromaticum]
MSSSALALPFGLPDIPFPAPGSDEILFVVRDVTEGRVNVSISDYWSNREVKRVPFASVRSQSVMSTSGTKWLTAYTTANVNGVDYTMAAVSGYKEFANVVYTKIAKGNLTKNYSSVSNFVGQDITEPNYKEIDEQPDYFVSSETYNSGSGTVMVLCISDRTTFSECRSQ